MAIAAALKCRQDVNRRSVTVSNPSSSRRESQPGPRLFTRAQGHSGMESLENSCPKTQTRKGSSCPDATAWRASQRRAREPAEGRRLHMPDLTPDQRATAQIHLLA